VEISINDGLGVAHSKQYWKINGYTSKLPDSRPFSSESPSVLFRFSLLHEHVIVRPGYTASILIHCIITLFRQLSAIFINKAVSRLLTNFLQMTVAETPTNELFELLKLKSTTLEQVTQLLESKPSSLWYRDDENNSPLHIAAQYSNLDIIKHLISTGHPWNVVNDNHISAGDIASSHTRPEIYEYLLNEGIRTELLLSYFSEPESNDDYLSRPLTYKDGVLYDDQNNAVMMGWEAPIMKKHVEILNPAGKSVLNVGFGLGIIDTMIQETNPTRHVIIEAHPDVYAKMKEWGWDQKPNVEIFFGKWQDVIGDVGVFDCVFFDTFGEDYTALKQFHEHLPNVLKDSSSIYTYFNGLAGTNAFFHDVYNHIADMDLKDIGLDIKYDKIPIDEIGDEVWKDAARVYYNLKTYDFPTCRLFD
jgi:protein arginine N-methyltransferase 2